MFRAHWWAAVAAVTRQVGDLELAEDAVQDACAAALAQWPAEGWPSSPRGWLIGTARHKALDRLRRDRRRMDKEAEAMREDSAPHAPGGQPPGCGDDVPASRTASASFSARRPSRRSRSRALWRAVPISHEPGLAGIPSAGHWARAAAQASCTASSATSRSPTWAVTAATAAHQWLRKTSSKPALSGEPPPS